jgi:selenocysteine lyase/cysteine desulfurase
MIDATQAVPFVLAASSTGSTTVVSGYKHLPSPRGTGYLYVRRDHWDELEPRTPTGERLTCRTSATRRPLTLAPDARRFDVSRGWFPGRRDRSMRRRRVAGDRRLRGRARHG